MTHELLEKELKDAVEGEVRFDTITKRAYSVDASIYEIEPIGIVTPKSQKDVLETIRIARKHFVPVIPRGAATGITGGCIGKGIIIDFSKYLNRILEINYEEEYAIIEPGVVQDQLNKALSDKGYRLGPDTSTGNRATIGGMVGNNAAGSRSLKYGKMVDHVLEIKLALANGEVLHFKPLEADQLEAKTQLNNAEGTIYKEIARIKKEYHEDIIKHFPSIPRRVSGYNLDELVKPGALNLSKIIVGSEGTLGLTLEIKVRIAKKPGATALCVVHFHDMIDAFNHVMEMLQFVPISLEMMDDRILEAGKQSPAMHNKLEWLVNNPAAVIVAEFEGLDVNEAEKKCRHFQAQMKANNTGYAHTIITDPKSMEHVWEVRKSGLGLLLSKRSYSRAIAFIEDITVAPEELAPFMEKFLSYLKSVNKQAGIYGHVGSGCMHIRPYIDLRSPDELKLMHKIMLDVTKLLLEHRGALSGEHGDGFIRTWLNPMLFGEKLYQAFCELKKAFDPENLMNPEKIVHGAQLLHDLRLDPELKRVKISTFLDFNREGGFELAADLCNGNGMCRKSEKLMCPSFQASGDEYDTTRARAQALRAVINGKLPIEDFTSPKIYDVLDLCLECKGCKTECPSQVDMAKMKSEFLYHYQKKHGFSLRNKIFGHIAAINRFSSPFAALFNKAATLSISKPILQWLGITPKRSLPKLASVRFSSWFKRYKQPNNLTKVVVLFNDTYTEFNEPGIGEAATKVLNALGYKVILTSLACCGRPMLSKGLLEEARRKAANLIDNLYPYTETGIPIIGLEPSCILTIKDDLRDVIGKENILFHSKAEAIHSHCLTFDEFLQKQIKDSQLPLNFKQAKQEVKVHVHCHQKALIGSDAIIDVLKAVPSFKVSEIKSGCCGMAGSFGYEAEHYDFSMKIANLHLFPAIKVSSKETLIVANGISCRSQIEHGTERKAIHLAEAIWRHLV